MAVEFTLPRKKNATVSFQAQSSSEISSSIDSGDVKFNVANPDTFGDFSIGDAVTLEDILENVDIRFVASTSGFSSGAIVQTWLNSGKETGMDLSHPEKLNFRSDVDKPVFNIGDTHNPFTGGAIKFVADATNDTHESKFLHFGGVAEDASNGERLKISGDFTMYAVFSSDKSAVKAAMSPLWVYSTIRETTNPVLEVLKTAGSMKVRLRGDNQIVGSYDAALDADDFGQDVKSKMTTANGDIVIIVFSRDKSGNFSVYDDDALGFINAKKNIGRFTDANNNDIFVDSFGPKCENRDITSTTNLGRAVDPVSVAQISDGDAVYLAEWGLFREAIDGQKSAALGRLLKQKYQIS